MKKIKLWKVKFLLLGQRQHERLKHEINRFYAQCVATLNQFNYMRWKVESLENSWNSMA